MSRGTCAARRQGRCTGQRGYSLSQKRISPLEPQEKDFVLSDCGLKNCTRCAIRCLLDDVSKRFDFLLSSLSLCLRFVTLTQFPSTTDFHCFVCRGGLAGTRCNMEADGGRKLVRTSTSWAERQRIIGAAANRIATSNAATPRAIIFIPEA